MHNGKLMFFCGKMGSGKTSKSKSIAEDFNAVLLSEDEWLGALYPNSIKSMEDYVKYSNLLKPQFKKLVQDILISGSNVVMDFPGNTVSQRNWFREIYSEINAPHELFYVNTPDQTCLDQIEKRRILQPERSATDTKEMFVQMAKYFDKPHIKEGFNITEYGGGNS